ncbi:uncharacterized protein V1518DRAFT_430145, partial [Limtongia smithiae]|uniref:uncharacterized protein n=1 Tax=Limtongia smithiae TaxID=1125753 RepID=UPI0034CEECCF
MVADVRGLHGFRDYVPDRDNDKIRGLEHKSARQFGKDIFSVPVVKEMIANWKTLADEPFKGITTDGKI